MHKPTETQARVAASCIPHPIVPPRSSGEVWAILDARRDREDPIDALCEYRYWRTANGRQQEIGEAFESGRPMPDDDG